MVLPRGQHHAPVLAALLLASLLAGCGGRPSEEPSPPAAPADPVQAIVAGLAAWSPDNGTSEADWYSSNGTAAPGGSLLALVLPLPPDNRTKPVISSGTRTHMHAALLAGASDLALWGIAQFVQADARDGKVWHLDGVALAGGWRAPGSEGAPSPPAATVALLGDEPFPEEGDLIALVVFAVPAGPDAVPFTVAVDIASFVDYDPVVADASPDAFLQRHVNATGWRVDAAQRDGGLAVAALDGGQVDGFPCAPTARRVAGDLAWSETPRAPSPGDQAGLHATLQVDHAGQPGWVVSLLRTCNMDAVWQKRLAASDPVDTRGAVTHVPGQGSSAVGLHPMHGVSREAPLGSRLTLDYDQTGPAAPGIAAVHLSLGNLGGLLPGTIEAMDTSQAIPAFY